MSDLNYCYHHSDFKFSDEALAWILKTYYEPFKDVFVPYDKYATTEAETKLFRKKISWEGTIALQEMRNYLSTWGIDPNYVGTPECGPDVFLFNSKEFSQQGFPHIDGYKWDDQDPNKRLPVLTRFNVVVKYNPDDPMHWWEEVSPGHPLVGAVEHTGKWGEKNFQHLAITGKDGAEKWKNLGTPSTTKEGLYKNHCAAFLRTDCAHSVDITQPGFRLVIATALNLTLEQLYKNKNLLS
jgi:hypothetical protein